MVVCGNRHQPSVCRTPADDSVARSRDSGGMKRTLAGAGSLALLAIAFLLPHASHAAPDEELLGKTQGYPIAPSMREAYRQPYIVGSFSAMDRLGPPCPPAPAAPPPPPEKAATGPPV